MTTKKGKSELMLALEQLEREKNIKKEDILRTVTDALVSALRKYFGKTAQVLATINPDTGEMQAFLVKKVVDEVFSDDLEITIEEARKVYPEDDVQVGDEIEVPVDIAGFSRIAAQTAKQVLVQKIREIEKNMLFDEFKPREGELVTGLINRINGRDVFVDLGKAEAILPYSEQIKKEKYRLNSRLRAIIHKVDKEFKFSQIILSRASEKFLEALFEVEVPEVAEKVVEIVKIVREPGFRSKVVVRSNSPQVDPVGACVGVRGSRIRMIMNEISDERIDLIPYVEDIEMMIVKAFSPAAVSFIQVDDKTGKKATVLVPDDQLAVAIGREGHNIRLVSRLTGWDIQVQSEEQRSKESNKNAQAAVETLSKVEGISTKVAETLVKMGITDITKISTLKIEDLAALQGIGEKTAQKIINGAKKYLEDKSREVKDNGAKEKEE